MAVADDKLDLGLGQAGVDIVSSPLHTPAGGLLEAENVEFIRELGQGGIGSRGALTPLNSVALNGPVLAMAAVPLPSPVDNDFTIPGFSLGGNNGLFLSANGGGTFSFLPLPGLAPTGIDLLFFEPYLPKPHAIDATHTAYTGVFDTGTGLTPIIVFDGINATTLAHITGRVQSMSFMDGYLYVAVVDDGYLVNDAAGTPVAISGRVMRINTSGGAVLQVGEDFGLGGLPDFCTIDAGTPTTDGLNAIGGYGDFTSTNGGANAAGKLTFRTGAAPAAIVGVPDPINGPTFGQLRVLGAGYPPDPDGASTYDAWKPTPTCADALAAQGTGTWQYHGAIRGSASSFLSMAPLNTNPFWRAGDTSKLTYWEKAVRTGLRHPTAASDDARFFGTEVLAGAEPARPYNGGTGAPGDHAFVARVGSWTEASALAPKTGNLRVKLTNAMNLLSPDANPGVAWFGHFIVFGGLTYVGYGSAVSPGGAAVDGKVYQLSDDAAGPWVEDVDAIGTFGGNVYPGQPFLFGTSLYWPWFGAPGTVDAGYLLKRTAGGVWSKVASGLQFNGVSFAGPVRA